MRIAIMQPGYLPWLGFFDLMHHCELFVIFDDVQYTKKDWRSRNKIRTWDGWMWLSVPVQTKHRRFQTIYEAEIDHTSNWRQKHLRAIEVNYGRAPYFKDFFPALKEIIGFRWEHLVDLDLELIKWLAAAFGMRRDIIKSSGLKTHGKREEKIIAVCEALGAKELYDTKAASTFLDLPAFEKKRIKLEFQDYCHPIYQQLHEPFLSHMSAIDLLFNYGPESRGVILNVPIH